MGFLPLESMEDSIVFSLHQCFEETGNHNQKHVDLPRKGSYSSIEEGCLFVCLIGLVCYVMLRSTMEPHAMLLVPLEKPLMSRGASILFHNV